MQTKCPSCDRVPAERYIDVSAMAATCPGCNYVYDISPEVPGSVVRRPPVALPKGIRVKRIEETGPDSAPYRSAARLHEELEIQWRWFYGKGISLILFIIVWLGFLGGMFRVSLEVPPEEGRILIQLFVLLFAIPGILLLYRVIATICNSTQITVRDSVLDIRHGPIPWSGNRRLPIARVRQLYCKKVGKATGKGRSEILYSVHAQIQDDNDICLIDWLPTSQQALYLEQTLEQCLKIRDVAVPDEMPRQGNA